MNGKKGKRSIHIRKEDYISFVIYEKANEGLLESIARQEHKGDIVCYVDRLTWDLFLVTPNDPVVTEPLRHQMAEEYRSSQVGKDPMAIASMKAHILERLSEQAYQYEAEIRAIRKQMVRVETSHDVQDLIAPLIREFSLGSHADTRSNVEQVIFLLHPELFG